MQYLRAIGLMLMMSGFAAHADEGRINVLNWGGIYTQGQVAAFAQPFEAETGIRVRMIDTDNPATAVKAQVEAGNVTADLASVGLGDAIRLCDEGLVAEIDLTTLEEGADGSAPQDDFLENGLGDCFVATDIYSTVIAYDASRYADTEAPQTIADFFDLERFPGRRGVRRDGQFILEMTLMADGVPPGEVYEVLATPDGQDRAFAKLDTIKDQIVWWEAGAQPVQLLADGEVVMTLAFNGRVLDAALEEGMPLKTIWDGQIYELEGWVIPKGAPHEEDARRFLAWSTGSAPLARFSELSSYGPPRHSSLALVGDYRDSKVSVAPHLPTAEANMATALASDVTFWADHDAELKQRFATWLAQ